MFCLLCCKPVMRSASFLRSVLRYLCRMLVIAMYTVSSNAFGCYPSANVCHKFFININEQGLQRWPCTMDRFLLLWHQLLMPDDDRSAVTCRQLIVHSMFAEMPNCRRLTLNFRHRASSLQDRRFATLQRKLFIYLINKLFLYLIFAWPCTIGINNIDNQLYATITAY